MKAELRMKLLRLLSFFLHMNNADEELASVRLR